MPERDREQEIGDRHGRQRTREKGKGAREGKRYLSWRDKGLPLDREGTDKWPIGTRKFMRRKGEIPC